MDIALGIGVIGLCLVLAAVGVIANRWRPRSDAAPRDGLRHYAEEERTSHHLGPF